MKFTTDIVIGLEIHIGINTKSKLFCNCPNKTSDEPNSITCPICLGHPGAKPVPNIQVIRNAILLGKALNSKIAKQVIFSRKSYFYPDLAKNYQITQYELPICAGGKIKLPSGKEIELTRIHIEEDPASLVHAGGIQSSSSSFIDYNRSGTPLLEMVTEPQISSSEEARDFLKTLIGILSYLEIFDIKSGLMKADVNVSIKENDYKRVEVKNINGFKEIQKAIEYEIKRQNNCVKEGKETGNETRGWNSDESSTYLLRKKESEDDYGYIIDADIAPYEVVKEDLDQEIPKLPVDFAKEISEKYGQNFEDVFIIANQKAFGKAYLKTVEIDPKLATNWFRHIIPTPYLSKYGDLLEVDKINEEEIIDLFKLFKDKRVSDKVAKDILSKLVEEKFSPSEYIKENNLEMVSDTGKIKKICEEVVKENPSAIEDYKNGEDKSINYMVGQVMKKSKGKANPGEARKIILDIIQ